MRFGSFFQNPVTYNTHLAVREPNTQKHTLESLHDHSSHHTLTRLLSTAPGFLPGHVISRDAPEIFYNIGVTILGFQQSTSSTQHHVSVSNLPTLTSLLKHCFQNLFKTYITKHGVSLWVLISLNQGLHVLQYDMYCPH